MARDPLGWARERGNLIPGSARMFDGPSPSGVDPCPPDVGPPAQHSGGRDASTAGLTRMIFPPRVEKLVLSEDFNANDYALILPAGAGSTVTSAKLKLRLPSGNVGWLQSFGLYILAPDAGASATWTLKINGGPVPGFDNIENFPGLLRVEVIPFDDMRVRVPNNGEVSVVITNNNANGPWTVGAFFGGWQHPLAAEKRAWDLNL